jgi:hypothetical protein
MKKRGGGMEKNSKKQVASIFLQVTCLDYFLPLKMEAVCFSEMLNLLQTTLCYIPQDTVIPVSAMAMFMGSFTSVNHSASVTVNLINAHCSSYSANFK